MKLVLHDYWRSSASYRVRIALALKGVAYKSRPVNLRDGSQRAPDNLARNPQGFVPTLVVDETPLTQSLAIIDWLDAAFPNPPFVPRDPLKRAHTLAQALVIACDIHPLDNLRVLKRLESQFDAGQEARDDWYRHWIAEGFAALEAMAAPRSGRFLFGDSPTLADICLVPQMYNARRFEVPLDDYPTLVRADAEANTLEPFQRAHPDAIAAAH